MTSQRAVTLPELVDTLILFDNVVLDHRFQQAIRNHPSDELRARLAELPPAIAQGARSVRRGGVLWEDIAGPGVGEELARKAEYFLLNAMLQAAEEQARLKVLLARHAPTRDVRDAIERSLDIHRQVTTTLRDALKALPYAETPAAWSSSGPVAAEAAVGDLRGQVEGEVRRLRECGMAPRMIHLSPTAVRHLRDQGLFQDDDSTVDDVPVVVELAWSGSEYAISTFESVPLEEILDGK